MASHPSPTAQADPAAALRPSSKTTATGQSCRSSPAGSPNIKGLGKLRYVVKQTFALLHQFKRIAVRW